MKVFGLLIKLQVDNNWKENNNVSANETWEKKEKKKERIDLR